MCGIGLAIRTIPKSHSGSAGPLDQQPGTTQKVSEIDESIGHAISPRGPDFQAQETRVISDASAHLDIEIKFFASVLHLRGLALTQQPISAPDTGNLLLWNGEVFDGLPLSDVENDGQAVLKALEDRGNKTIPEVFLGIEGPYAFIYYDSLSKQIWFGRDPLGRRSLMKLENEKDIPHRSLISVASHYEGRTALLSSELATHSLFCVELKDVEDLCILPIARGSPPILLNRQIPLEADRVPPSGQSPPSLITASGRLRDNLINVAFENPRAASNSRRNNQPVIPDIFSVPDRHTGEESWKELCQLTPGRTWRFVKVDVWMKDYLKYKDQIIELMWPNDTVMDLSIAAALFFAAWGVGSCRLDPDSDQVTQSYRSPARVFLSGLGADELLGGYSRHRSAFSSASPWINLIQELQLDIDRIPTRNLGRDDRIIAHHGREVRYPFLDRDVIDTLAGLPVHLKCDLALEKGTGDKLLLRVLARELGLSQASKLVKRAIQFGARSAKLEGLEKGTAGLQPRGVSSSTLDMDVRCPPRCI
ncbi:hypothetical protein PGTUg99_023814 [Puccinia graminis f. sp. tritici]|uniref:Asparagine synthetase domain-containing protein n=1 Tax=Puccinia graminis f. sp. tritici TaxID=56615 RepID=A0A5B0RTH5_PUCGR|nr:hypothetical protein PGTUg99_023814 [Puccinia graminis f. sp. tritici]